MTVLMASCKNEKPLKLSLKKYSRLVLKEDRIYVALLKSFKNDIPCQSYIKNANVYLCKDIHSNDTILLFEPCTKMPGFASDPYDQDVDLAIEKDFIVNDTIVELMVSSNFDVKPKYKYIIGTLTQLLY
jgi:hypothetical protein